VKQLNSAVQRSVALDRRFAKLAMSRPAQPRRRPQQPRRQNLGITSTNVPVEVAFTVAQNTQQRVHIETARELIGQFAITADTAPGSSMRFNMNPLLLLNTRIAKISANYQKFRFRKLALIVQSSVATSVTGLYAVGYNSNPDAEYTTSSAIAAVTNLPGAQSTNVWKTVHVNATIQDKNKWYNLDADSNEIMQTTQGYFAIVNQVTPGITAPGVLQFPIWLDYSIELTGSATTNVPNVGAPFMIPGGTWVWSNTLSDWSFTVDPDETLTFPLIATGGQYAVVPGYNLGVGTENVPANFVEAFSTGYSFATSLQDLQTGKFINGTGSSAVLRTTWALVN